MIHSSPASNSPEPLNIIFVHGWGCGWQDWSGVLSLLPSDVNVGVAKLPGSPDAVPLNGTITLNDCATHVINLADDLCFDRFTLVGHSMGARIAIELAANWQDRVSHLILVDGSNVPEDPDEAVARLSKQFELLSLQQWAEAAVESMMVENLDPALMRSIVKRATEYSPDVLKAYYHAMAAWDRDYFVAAVGSLTCPVTIFQSTSLDENEVRQSVMDHPSSLWLDVFRERVSDVVVRLVPDVGHFLMLEQPTQIADWIEEIS